MSLEARNDVSVKKETEHGDDGRVGKGKPKGKSGAASVFIGSRRRRKRRKKRIFTLAVLELHRL